MYGARSFTRLMIPSPSTGIVSDKSTLVRFEVRRRRWLLPPLVRTNLPDPVRRNRLDVALWVFNLYFFPGFRFLGTVILLSQNFAGLTIPRNHKFNSSGIRSKHRLLNNSSAQLTRLRLFLFSVFHRAEHHGHHTTFHIWHLLNRSHVL